MLLPVAGLICLALTLAAASDPHSAGWGYARHNGPGKWASHGYSHCGQAAQSPIDLITDHTTYSDTYRDLHLTNYHTTRGATYTLKNNGHSVKVDVAGLGAAISGSGLANTYSLDQFHFHWGSHDSVGSEHQQNGHQYPMEIHFVHHCRSYADLSEAVPNDDGLAVIGVFVQIGNENPALAEVIKHLRSIAYQGSSTNIQPFNLDALLPDDVESFYRYKGSLTTPTCDESVQWINMRTPITASREQLAAFRTLLHMNAEGAAADESMVDNFRPVQKLNGRHVYRTFRGDVCPDGFRRLGEGSACYKVVYERKSWWGAEYSCRYQYGGSHLASVRTYTESRALYDYLHSVRMSALWLGGVRDEGQEHWQWVATGETVGFQAWAAGQPDNHRSEEHCITAAFTDTDTDGYWKDSDCNLKKYFVCEK